MALDGRHFLCRWVDAHYFFFLIKKSSKKNQGCRKIAKNSC
jgi:hypothetical protein